MRITLVAFQLFFFGLIGPGISQNLQLNLHNGFSVTGASANGHEIIFTEGSPLFSVMADKQAIFSNDLVATEKSGLFSLPGRQNYLQFSVSADSGADNLQVLSLFVINKGPDTITVENVVPFGQQDDRVHITSSGPWNLARAKLYRPGKIPVGVILPDNAWELGYGAIGISDTRSLSGTARRKDVENGKKYRYETHLYPGGSVSYDLYFTLFDGEWQNGLREVFNHRFLFDLEEFDNTLYQREDLDWIKHDYLMVLQFAWDHRFFDPYPGRYNFKSFLDWADPLTGGIDVFGIWPTWPTLGLDERNQWDLYRDLPGGLDKLREISNYAKSRGTRFFIAYNPWDQSTRNEDSYRAIAGLIDAIDADGVVLDTRGRSSYRLQKTADSVKAGVIMYSEGMAVVKDMPGIISGRVHDAIFMPPPLNLNKLIRPDFAIFRVCQLSQGRIHRETSISLFNGYGTELNTFAPGRPEWIEEEYRYLGNITRILRENTDAFNSWDWTPLIPTLSDSIWVNKWPAGEKTLYTVFSLIPAGFSGPLFKAEIKDDSHWVSIWHHEEIAPDTINGDIFIACHTEAFDQSWLNTRREGSVDCIAEFPCILDIRISRDTLFIEAGKGDKVRVWAGNPSYERQCLEFRYSPVRINLTEVFGRFEGKVVVQLMDKRGLLIDERTEQLIPGTPRLISRKETENISAPDPADMVKIPGGWFRYNFDMDRSFIPYPDYDTMDSIYISSFFIDRYPVTNAGYYEFISKSGYQPDDTANYLKHWNGDKYPDSLRNHPVVCISYEDAQAYADWSGKRLPTEAEWQYAAQGPDGRLYPWGNEADSSRCNTGIGYTTPVDRYPEGASPFGVMDLTGNVWQLTNDVYDNGSYYFVIIRGGSYYDPTSSWWYVKGGPQPLNKTQMLLRVSQGFERNTTVGFRCVADLAE